MGKRVKARLKRSALVAALCLLTVCLDAGDLLAGRQADKASRFIGRWMAEGSNRSGITRVEMHANEGRIYVQVWRRCGSLDCDWGEDSTEASDADDGTLSIKWERDSMIEMQTFALDPDGGLRIEGRLSRVDAQRSNPESYVVKLARSALPEVKGGAASAPEAIKHALSSTVRLYAETPEGKQVAVAIGFFVQPELIATSYNAIKPFTKLTAHVGGRQIDYKIGGLIGFHAEMDTAILSAPGAKGWPLAIWSKAVMAGVNVFVPNNTEGGEWRLSQGSVGDFRTLGEATFLEVSALLSTGDLGSPVMNKRGEVLGILSTVDAEKRVAYASQASSLLSLLSRIQLPAQANYSHPVILSVRTPGYTKEARENKVSGVVKMNVLVGADGLVKQVEVISGLPDGLTEEAVKAMHQTTFKPAMRNGEPVESWLILLTTFKTN